MRYSGVVYTGINTVDVVGSLSLEEQEVVTIKLGVGLVQRNRD